MIKYIKMQNIVSNDKEITIDFSSKYNEKYKDDFFNYSIKNKQRSKYKEATLKTIGIIGRNAAYKTSTLSAIDKCLSFLLNFKNQLRDYVFKDININKAVEWYYRKTLKDPFDIGINMILEEYWKHLNKKKHIFDKKDEYAKHFYEQNVFNNKEKLSFEIQFDKKNLNLRVTMNKEKGKFFYSINLNGQDYDPLKAQELEWFKYKFFSLPSPQHNVVNSHKHINISLDLAFNYLYKEKFGRKSKRLLLLLQKIDPSIINIKTKAKGDAIKILKITREYSGYDHDISVNQLSTGTKIFIVYLYHILKSDFVIFDEIENALHLKLVELLIDVAKHNNKQIFFSTHSPFLLNTLLKKFQIYIYELTNSELEITLASKLFRQDENLANKYLLDLVSNPDNSDLDSIRTELY